MVAGCPMEAACCRPAQTWIERCGRRGEQLEIDRLPDRGADFRELDRRWGGERSAAGNDEQGEEGQRGRTLDAQRRISEAATRPTVSKKQVVGSGMVVDCVAMPPEPETDRRVISPVV